MFIHNMLMQSRVPRLTILHLNEKTSLSTGSVIQMLLAAAHQAAEGHRVVVSTRHGEEIRERVRKSGVEHVALPFRNELDVSTVTGLHRLIARIKPDIIHVHKGKAHSLVLMALIGNPHPALIVNRGVSFPLTWMNRAKYQTSRVSKIVTVCQAIKDIVIKTGLIEESKVQVIHAGTDVDAFDPARVDRKAFRDEIALSEDSFLFIHAGIRPWKGCRETIAAFDRLRATRPRARLAFVGFDGRGHSDNLEAAIAERGLGDLIHVVGHRSDMEHVLAAGDAILDGSWAGTGITGTIREGMAMARPVIATRCGGNAELIDSDRVGWLIEPADVDALAHAMREVMDNPELALARGVAARDHVVANFSMQHRARLLTALYRDVQHSVAVGSPVRQVSPDRSY